MEFVEAARAGACAFWGEGFVRDVCSAPRTYVARGGVWTAGARGDEEARWGGGG